MERCITSSYSPGFKLAKASGADFKPFLPLLPAYAKYFLTRFTLISKMIKFDLSGTDFSLRAEKLETYILYTLGFWQLFLELPNTLETGFAGIAWPVC